MSIYTCVYLFCHTSMRVMKNHAEGLAFQCFHFGSVTEGNFSFEAFTVCSVCSYFGGVFVTLGCVPHMSSFI